MGLDLLDVKFRIEKEFHIDVSNEELLGLVRDKDIIVGDLYELLLRKMQLRDLGRHSVRLNAYLWSQVRSALHSATGVPLEQIELGLALESLFPRATRRDRWETLRDGCPYKIRELDYPMSVRVGAFLAAAGVVAIEQLQIWQIPGAKWFWHLLGLVAIWMVCETYAKVLSVCAGLRNRLPSGMTTAKELCRSVMSANYADIGKGSQIVLDERCSAVWEQLVEVLTGVLGVDSTAVTFRSRLFADLGAA
jgi:hypothetical protein